MEEAKQHLRLLSCVLDSRDLSKLLALSNFEGTIDSGKSAACLPIRNDVNKVLLLQVFKDRWFTADVDALNKHPVSVARIVQQWFSQLALQPWNVSACVPLASIEANLSLRVLKAQTGVGAPMRKFLTDQLKDRDDDNNAPSRVRLSIFDRAQYADLYKWCRGPCWHDATVGGFEGLRKLLFEIVWTLSVAQAAAPGWKHNDLHAANVLVTLDKAVCAQKPSAAPATTTDAAAAPTSGTAAGPADIALATDDAMVMDNGSSGALGPVAPSAPTQVLPQHQFYYQYSLSLPASKVAEAAARGTAAPGALPPSTTTKQPHAHPSDLLSSPLGTSGRVLIPGGDGNSSSSSASGAASSSLSHASEGNVPVTYTVPAYPCKAMLADFDFAWLPGHPNQKVLEFQADDPVWGVTSTPDDCYDLFMLSYHLYITFFEQLLERNQAIASEVFMRAWRKASTAADAGDEDGAKMWRLNSLNDVRTFHVTRDQMERLWAPQRDLQRFLEYIVPHRFFGKTDRSLEADGIHRWRYNEVAVAAGLHRELHTPTEALIHPYFQTFRDLARTEPALMKNGTLVKGAVHPINAPPPQPAVAQTGAMGKLAPLPTLLRGVHHSSSKHAVVLGGAPLVPIPAAGVPGVSSAGAAGAMGRR